MRNRSVGLLCLVLASALSACGEAPSSSSPSAYAERLLVYGPQGVGPDPDMTPGDLCDEGNADFDGFRYGKARVAHCRREVSVETKVEVAKAYGIYGKDRHDYQIDHFIPLNIGGSNDVRNLWPLIVPLAEEKSRYEAYLMGQVSSHRLTQKQAIAAIKAWRPGFVW